MSVRRTFTEDIEGDVFMPGEPSRTAPLDQTRQGNHVVRALVITNMQVGALRASITNKTRFSIIICGRPPRWTASPGLAVGARAVPLAVHSARAVGRGPRFRISRPAPF